MLGSMAMIDGTATGLWHGFVRAHRLLLARLDAELQDGHGLPLSRFEALAHLHADGPLRMHEFAERLILSRSATTRFVDRLEKEGLVRRRLCVDDRRGMELVLTATGRSRLEEAAPTHRRAVERYLVAPLGVEVLSAVTDALTRLGDDLD